MSKCYAEPNLTLSHAKTVVEAPQRCIRWEMACAGCRAVSLLRDACRRTTVSRCCPGWRTTASWALSGLKDHHLLGAVGAGGPPSPGAVGAGGPPPPGHRRGWRTTVFRCCWGWRMKSIWDRVSTTRVCWPLTPRAQHEAS